MHGPQFFCRLADGGVDKLTRRAVAAYNLGILLRAFSRYMCAGVRLVAKWAGVLRRMPLCLSKPVAIQLTVKEFQDYPSSLGIDLSRL